MPVRQANYNDLSAIYSVVAEGFMEEGLNVAVFPHRHEHPDHYRRAWRHKLREYYWDYSRVFAVSYDVDGSGRETIKSTAVWTRCGDGWQSLWGVKGWLDPRLLITHVLKIIHSVHRLLLRNRASIQPSPSRPQPLTFWTWEAAVIQHVERYFTPPSLAAIATGQTRTIQTPTTSTPTTVIKPFSSSSSSSSSPSPPPPNPNPNPPFWELSILTTVPSTNGQGHGRALADWGLQRARHDRLPAMVIAAEHKERFCQRCGFGCLVGWATDGPGNPLPEMGIGGGAILWTTGTDADTDLRAETGGGDGKSSGADAAAGSAVTARSSEGSFTLVDQAESVAV